MKQLEIQITTFWRRRVLRLLAVLCGVLVLASGAHAQYVPCPDPGPIGGPKDPVKLQEIKSDGQGRLRGTILLADRQEAFELGTGKCVPQLMRYFQNPNAPGPAPGSVPLPYPGPTLRAQLGDVVELLFLNQVNPLDYGKSIDIWESADFDPNKPGAGCDTSTTGYPVLQAASPPAKAIVDTFPNCFHGSTSGNIHFHGTHTSPSGTADNVFLNVRPSPRVNGQPTVTEATATQQLGSFFGDCEKALKANNLLQWPLMWGQLPTDYLAGQFALLVMDGVGKPDDQQLMRADFKSILAKQFPQYYIGAFPYCFLLPDFPGTMPPGSKSQLRMGQAPGTHWYHAHKHGSTALNVANGMAGAFIIEDNRPDGYDGHFNTLYGKGWASQQPTLVVNQIATTPGLERGGAPGPAKNVVPFSVNGKQNPNLTMYPGQVQLWRIVNASSISGFYIRSDSLPAGFTWRQTAQDGVQFDDFNYNSRAGRPVFVAPGNRVDLLVQASATATSGPVQIVQDVSLSQAQATKPFTSPPLLTIQIEGTGPAMDLPVSVAPRPNFLADITGNVPAGPPPANKITFKSSGGGGTRQHTIDNAKFSMGHSVDIKPLNTTEEWTIVNETVRPKVDHPFHIHLNPFQITEVFDPNAPLLTYNGQPTGQPLYVVSATKPTLQMGQCWLNPSEKNTWKGCATFDPKAPLLNSKGQQISANLQPVSPSNPSPAPLYVQQTTKPALMLPGQCWLNPNDQTTWRPCPHAGATNIWWDVFPIAAAYSGAVKLPANVVIPGYFKMRSRFVDYGGAYVIHCHILAHEDRGMMVQVNLGTNLGTTLEHH